MGEMIEFGHYQPCGNRGSAGRVFELRRVCGIERVCWSLGMVVICRCVLYESAFFV